MNIEIQDLALLLFDKSIITHQSHCEIQYVLSRFQFIEPCCESILKGLSKKSVN
jgi:hypothetical protein